MTRIDELQSKYPSIPRDVIVKYDVDTRGMRDTDELDKISSWAGTLWSYQSYDHDVTLKQFVERRPGRLKPGLILRPNGFRLKSGIGPRIMLNSKSSYEIREIGSGQFGLFEGDEKAEDIYFPIPKPRLGPESVTSKGTPVSALISNLRRCFSIFPVRYCEYFNTGEQCKFCNLNPSQEDARSIGLTRPKTVNLDEVLEAYKIQGSDFRYIEGHLEMGGFMNSENEAKIYTSFVEKLASAFPDYTPSMGMFTEGMTTKDMGRMKEAGLASIGIQMEVWDPDLFAEVCPGKAKHMPQEGWKESMLEAVDIFGAGNVFCTFVGGVTMLARNGHKTWQEARDSHIEGNHWLIKNGIVPTFTTIRVVPGSVYGEEPSNRNKVPPTEYYLEVAQDHHETMLEYGLYDKMNKFNFCGFCCTSGPTYCGEIGMITLGGDVGGWMSDVVPDEANWVAKFIASIKSPAKTQ